MIEDRTDTDALVEWFKREGRDLPWRQNPSPYAVWISEVMLQQTRAGVVIEYFIRWMERFPSIAALAEASREEVIKTWEGLGYYARARALHEGAQHVMQVHGGELPSTLEELQKIKGIGKYTAGAILSFAFHQKAAAVDGNVLRVLSRYFYLQEDITKNQTKQACIHLTEKILTQKEEEPWVTMEALIELGALICHKKPHCLLCPIQKGCQAFQRGKTHQIPLRTKKATTPLTRWAFILKQGKNFLLRKETSGKVMTDLYEFPYWEVEPEKKDLSSLAPYLKATWGIEAQFAQLLPEVKHTFTRFRVRLHPTLWVVKEAPFVAGYEWVEQEELLKLPFSSGHRKILKILTEKGVLEVSHG